ncbi:bacteriophage holin [Natronorubrum sp. FCH18a]|uniref:bacteriophage holin n=1 Tax=Natronorubrum sp. FCH18a TaxID=3447018 RepID=UPI003F51A1A3
MRSQNQPRDPAPVMESMDDHGDRLDPVAFGLSLGTTMAASIALIGTLSRLGVAERWRALFADMYPGFEGDEGGTIAGIAWGAADGFVFGVVVGRLYNAFRRAY